MTITTPHPPPTDSTLRACQIAKLLKIINENGNKLMEILLTGREIDPKDSTGRLISNEYHESSRNMIAGLGLMQNVVQVPGERLLELCGTYHEATAVHVLADAGIPDVLAEAGEEGMSGAELGKRVGIEPSKLTRIMRLLAANHVVKETAPNTFANDRVSSILVNNLPLRSYVRVADFFYPFGAHTRKTLMDPITGPSFSPWQTAFQGVMNTDKAFWEWLEETDEDGNKRPELETFGLGMVGHGKLHDRCLLFDYPWGTLGAAKVVDVGGGVGGFCMDLYEQFPELTFVVQDRPPVIEQAKAVWGERFPGYEKRVTLMAQDFFEENAVKDADVYVLRCVIHDWPTEPATGILAALTKSIPEHAKILLVEQVLQPTTTSPKSRYPIIPKNFGTYSRVHHIMDLTMMSSVNAQERTESEYRAIVEGAGLKVDKVWETRGPLSFVEIRRT
ncbi:hypothetical protein HK097_006521 [Rhizophlyctis rosea]|uniref:O-methyltransferase domain-containing protein n=1 Tax=Rhizophlyctis rosea TaxID=64517 RepID=A0AAD5SEC6_9FUNG|nr:hypothetical protein HK097_006521 [Rhizophlyctis rosea]